MREENVASDELMASVTHGRFWIQSSGETKSKSKSRERGRTLFCLLTFHIGHAILIDQQCTHANYEGLCTFFYN